MEGEDPGERQRWMINGAKVRRQHRREMLKRTQITLTGWTVKSEMKDVCGDHPEKREGYRESRSVWQMAQRSLYHPSLLFPLSLFWMWSDSLKCSKLLSILRQSVQCADTSQTYFCSQENTHRSLLIQGVWPQRIRIWSRERGMCDEISALGYSYCLKVSTIHKIRLDAFDRTHRALDYKHTRTTKDHSLRFAADLW